MLQTKIVILNWNGEKFLRRFLPAVLRSLPEGVDAVVADNGSTDGSAALLASDFPQVGFLPLGENYGFAGGYNRALAKLSADCFILLNNDVEPAAGWVEPLLKRLEENPLCAAVQPKILSFADRGKFEYAGAAGGFIDSLGYPFCRGRILGTVEADNGQYDDCRKVFWASGACMAVRASAFRQAGGFDDDFFAHMEEIDLCWRMQLLGYDIEIEPASVIYHVGGGTLPTGSPQKIYLNFRNSLYMLHKNLPDGARWRLRARKAADFASMAVYFLGGRFGYAKAVCRAHRDYRRAKENLDGKRAEIKALTVAQPAGVYRGWIIWRRLWGKNRFGKMM